MELHQKNQLGQNRISKITGINTRTICSWIYYGNKPYDAWTKDDYLKHSENKRASKIGSLNPAWKGDKAKPQSGRARAEEMYYAPKGFERHHIDGNPLNNDPDNVLIVTRREHLILDGRMRLLKKGLWNIKKMGKLKSYNAKFSP